MSQRRLHLVVLLAAALVAIGLSGAVDAASDHSSFGDKAGAAFANRAPGVDPSAARFTGEERPGRSQRLLKQRSILFAVVAALLLLPVLGRRRAVDFVHAWLLRVSWWLPRLGRAPPVFLHS